MTTKRNRWIAVIAAVVVVIGGAFAIAAVVGGDAPVDATPRPSTTASTEPEPRATPAPTEAATPEPVVPTEPGAIVPADMVEAARAAGALVYVSPNGDGAGVVIETGVMPDAVVADAAAAPRTIGGMSDVGAVLNTVDGIWRALDDAGVPALFIIPSGAATDGAFMPDGFSVKGSTLAVGAPQVVRKPKADVLAAAEAYIAANPGTLLIDLTA
ncbi:hypothetical protein CHO01_31550 [Cellulomonas hominis]|uniref:Uncharacterized protein n=1 Tax=Cellulomonas hominis TaxID=156981 RepID=A0A511FFK5_9CELL|nr:hypothetical protein [Cellulomonas hominis]MBB5474785.1 hypothetical protein [Cellulomonas hominis]NKY05810.1 hypothetical protein [Cellulomonas hominis]GEL48039.1 hypothetical protein CHO01_31550 [Cellulomonas hominis]